MENGQDDGPMFSAVSSSARQLFILLRCISFANKAQVQLSPEGMRFSVEESSVMEGLAFLGKDLFTSYTYHAPPKPPSSPTTDPDPLPTFEISLPSLLETLQIFGLADLPSSRPGAPWSHNLSTNPSAFDTRILGVSGLCKLHYPAPGSPLSITIEEPNLTTTCELQTYEPRAAAEDIPFARSALALKVIMRASWLADALAELAAANPDTLVLEARRGGRGGVPVFALAASGPLGSAVVEFGGREGALLETFQVAPPKGRGRVVNRYKFGLVRAAQRAMGVATKVSIRGDEQGVLSLQFMVEVDAEKEKVSFVDFRFVPLAEDGEGDGGEEESGDGMDEDDDMT